MSFTHCAFDFGQNDSIHEKRKEKTSDLRRDVGEYMQAHQQRLISNDGNIQELFSKINTATDFNDKVSTDAADVMHELITIYRQAVQTLVESSKQDLSRIQECFDEQMETESVHLVAVVDALEYLTGSVKMEDEKTIGKILSIHDDSMQKLRSDESKVRSVALELEVATRASLVAACVEERLSHTSLTEISLRDLKRVQIAKSTGEESFEGRRKLFIRYCKEIQKMNQEIGVLESNQTNALLVVKKSDLMNKIHNERLKAKSNSLKETKRLIRLSQYHEKLRTKLQSDCNLINDVHRMTNLCGGASEILDGNATISEVDNEIKNLIQSNGKLEEKINAFRHKHNCS